MASSRNACLHLLRSLSIAITATLLVFWSGSSRADIPPSCDLESGLVTCAAADVGKPCSGGGACFEIMCSSGAGVGTKLYKCDTCPTIVAAPAGTCTISNMTTACGDGNGGTGTCGAIRPWCNTTSDKYVCQTPAPTTTGTGGSAGGGASGVGGASGSAGSIGSGKTSSSSGCDITPVAPPKPTAIGLGLIAIGLLVFFVNRARRRR